MLNNRFELKPAEAFNASQLSRAEIITLAFIIISAAWVRLYALGVPSMWLDEIVVPLAAENSIDYIIERAKGGVDTHPPYYHILVKGMLAIGNSDAWLRAHSAISGILSVIGIFFLGRALFNTYTGLIAAGLLSVNNLHILLSRQVRPYSLIILFSTISLYTIFRFIQTGRYRWALLSLISNIIFAPLQFLTILILGAQSCIVFIACITGNTPLRLRDAFIFTIISLATFTPSALFLFGKFSKEASAHPWDIIVRYLQMITPNISPWDNLLTAMAITLLLIVTTYKCINGKDFITISLLTYIFIPLAPLIAVRYNSYFNPWHISFIMPPAILAISNFIQSMATRLKIPSLFFLSMYCIIIISINYSSKYYLIDSHTGQYHQIADILVTTQQDESIPLPVDSSTIDGANWYTKLNGTHLYKDIFTKEFPSAPAISIITFQDFAHFAKNANEFYSTYGNLASSARYPWGSIHTIPIQPKNNTADSFPHNEKLTSEPLDFYSRITNVRNIGIIPFFGFSAIPYLNEIPAHFDYTLSLPKSNGQNICKIIVSFKNRFPNIDHFSIEYSYDGIDFSPIDTINIYEKPEITIISKSKPEHNKLILRFSMVRKSQYPGYTNTDNTTIQFNSLSVYANSILNEHFESCTLDISKSGFGTPEKSEDIPYAWGYGPESTFTFTTPSEQDITIEYGFNNPINNQDVIFSLNGEIIASHKNIESQPWLKKQVEKTVTLKAHRGVNIFRIAYRSWNANPLDLAASFAPQDGRTMAVAFTKLLINSRLQDRQEYVVAF